MPGIKVKQSKRRNKRETCYDKGGGRRGKKGKRFSRGGSEGMVEKEERRKDKWKKIKGRRNGTAFDPSSPPSVCAIIVSIVCSTVLTVCGPFHLCYFCSHSFTIAVLSFSFSVSSVRLFQFVCQSLVRPRGYCIPGLNVSSVIHRCIRCAITAQVL